MALDSANCDIAGHYNIYNPTFNVGTDQRSIYDAALCHGATAFRGHGGSKFPKSDNLRLLSDEGSTLCNTASGRPLARDM